LTPLVQAEEWVLVADALSEVAETFVSNKHHAAAISNGASTMQQQSALMTMHQQSG
jgi:hypothetical protein